MSQQPFEGLKVVEFGQFVAVPVAAQLLADGGAEVIKVEALSGDPIRSINPLVPGESRYFISRNNGKHTLPLALSDTAAKPVIEALVKSADVVLMNLRPGLAEKLGLEPSQLAERFPKLIIGSVSGFGNAGPEAGDAGMDLVVQARSGLMAANGRIIDGRPAAGDPVSADFMCAMTLAFGVSSALLRRARTGFGGLIDTSLLQAALSLTSSQLVRSEDRDAQSHTELLEQLAVKRAEGATYAEQLALLRPNQRTHMFNIYYRTFNTLNSFIAVACGSHALRVKFSQALGFVDEGLDAQFSGELETHYNQLAEDVERLIASQPSDHWVDMLRAAGVPVSKVLLPIELYDDGQVNANALLHRFEHPLAGAMTVVAPPLSLDEDGFRPGPPTAAFGSETRAILNELGFIEEDVARLIAAGVTHEGLE